MPSHPLEVPCDLLQITEPLRSCRCPHARRRLDSMVAKGLLSSGGVGASGMSAR